MGAQKVSDHAAGEGGGGTTRFGVALAQGLEVLTILKGDVRSFHPLKKAQEMLKVLPCLEVEGGGGVSNKFRIHHFSNFVAPLPVINDQSPHSLFVSLQIGKKKKLLMFLPDFFLPLKHWT